MRHRYALAFIAVFVLIATCLVLQYKLTAHILDLPTPFNLVEADWDVDEALTGPGVGLRVLRHTAPDSKNEFDQAQAACSAHGLQLCASDQLTAVLVSNPQFPGCLKGWIQDGDEKLVATPRGVFEADEQCPNGPGLNWESADVSAQVGVAYCCMVPGPRPMDCDPLGNDAHQSEVMLAAFTERVMRELRENGMNCWFHQGNVLSAVRDGALVPTCGVMAYNPEDMDIACPWEEAHVLYPGSNLSQRWAPGNDFIWLKVEGGRGNMFTGIFLDPCDRPPEGMISTGNRFGPRHHWDFDIYWIEKTTPPPGWGVMPFQPPPEGMEATEEWVYGVRHMDQYKYCADYFAKTRDVQLVVDNYTIAVAVPKEAEAYLEVTYGKDWRTPQPSGTKAIQHVDGQILGPANASCAHFKETAAQGSSQESSADAESGDLLGSL